MNDFRIGGAAASVHGKDRAGRGLSALSAGQAGAREYPLTFSWKRLSVCDLAPPHLLRVVLVQHIIKAHHLRNDLSYPLRRLDEVAVGESDQKQLRMAWKSPMKSPCKGVEGGRASTALDAGDPAMHPDVNPVVVRENTEDLYAGIEHQRCPRRHLKSEDHHREVIHPHREIRLRAGPRTRTQKCHGHS